MHLSLMGALRDVCLWSAQLLLQAPSGVFAGQNRARGPVLSRRLDPARSAPPELQVVPRALRFVAVYLRSSVALGNVRVRFDGAKRGHR